MQLRNDPYLLKSPRLDVLEIMDSSKPPLKKKQYKRLEYYVLFGHFNIDFDLSGFEHVVCLDLGGCGLDVFPEKFRVLVNLEVLNLSQNNISVLPEWMREFKKLKVIDCSGNQFGPVFRFSIPKQMSKLVIGENPIHQLVLDGDSSNLRHLDISGSEIAEMPIVSSKCAVNINFTNIPGSGYKY